MSEKSNTDDPALWSVDRVILELCHNQDANWAGSGISVPVPRAQDVEQAFRENDVDGDVLLQLSLSDFQAMSFTSIGQIKKLNRIVQVLRTHSPIYSSQANRSISTNIVGTIEPSPSLQLDPFRTSAQPSTLQYAVAPHFAKQDVSNLHSPSVSRQSGTPSAVEQLVRNWDQRHLHEESKSIFSDMAGHSGSAAHHSDGTKRPNDAEDVRVRKKPRIQPVLESAPAESYQHDRTLFDVPFDQPEISDNAARSSDKAATELSAPQPHSGIELTDQNDDSLDAYDRLLQLHPAFEDDYVFPLYGESDQEDVEMTTESSTPEPEDLQTHDSDTGVLTTDQLDDIIEERMEAFANDWKERKLDVTQKRAHKKWTTAVENPQVKEAMLRGIQRDYEHVVARLAHLKFVVSTIQFSKVEDVIKQCESLQVSVAQREEYALYIETLNSKDEPPSPVMRRVRKPLAREESQHSNDILCESDSDDSLDDFLSDDSDEIDEGQDGYYDAQSHLEHGIVDDSEADPNDLMQLDENDGVSREEDSPGVSDQANAVVVDQPIANEIPRTPHKRTMSNSYAEDADDEDGGGSLSFPKKHSPLSQRAAEGKIRNPLLLPISVDSSDADDTVQKDNSRKRSAVRLRRGHRPMDEDQVIVVSSSPSSSGDDEVKGVPSDEENYEIRTPELNPNDMAPASTKNELEASRADVDDRTRDIDTNTLSELSKTTWRNLRKEAKGDRVLALAKAITEIDTEDAAAILRYSSRLDMESFEYNLKEGLFALKSGDWGEINILSIPQHKQSTVLSMTTLWMCFVLARKYSEDDVLRNEDGNQAWEMIDSSAAEVFHKTLLDLLRKHIGMTQQTDNLAPPPFFLDDSSEDHSVETREEADGGNPLKSTNKPKKGKRTESPSNSTLDTQRMAKQRVADQEARKALIDDKLAQSASQTGVIDIPVNFKEPLVMLTQHIAQRIKPHQINGLQFIWRELVEDPQQQGCLLAHTMGLGKTMQVISVLVTIAQCVRSPDPSIKAHIPPRLHDLRILILSPPALTENWFDELMYWMPEHDTLGPICKITNRSKQPYYDIKQWSESGGVLLMGYDRLVSYTKTPSRGQTESEEQYQQKVAQHRDMSTWMFDQPKIVIADEAHMLKNPTAKRAETAMKIKTTSRIALTGSPLSNHLEEYWAMINFIAPGYLGDLSKFKQKFVEPINRCLSVDSGDFDRRLGLRKMHVLKKILDPKVNRADITAIQNDLPPKTEFFISVPLTDTQLEMYRICVNFFLGVTNEGELGKGKTASLWQWIAVLSLLCNHPWTFEQKLKDPERRKKNRKAILDDSGDSAEDDVGAGELARDDVDVTNQPTMLEAMKLSLAASQIQALASPSDLKDSALSYRMTLVKAIIKEALQLREKCLVFSHSLLTLDYMELVMADLNCPFERIDGGLATDKRQQAAKDFNADISPAQAFLISTRAGGLGLNLFGATRVIILDYSFNPSWEEQAIGRAYRLGQKRPVFVYRFRSGGTFEDVTFNQTIFKTQLFTRIIDHKAVLRKGSKFEARRYLVNPTIPPQEDFSACKGKDPQIMDKLMLEFDFIRNIVLTETFAQDIDEGLTAVEIEEANQEIEDERLARDDPHGYALRLATRSALKYRTARTSTATLPQRTVPPTAVQLLGTTLHGAPSASPSTNTPYLPVFTAPTPDGAYRESWEDHTTSENTNTQPAQS